MAASSRSNTAKPSPQSDVLEGAKNTLPAEQRILTQTGTGARSAATHPVSQGRATVPAAAVFIIAKGKGNPIYANSGAKSILTHVFGSDVP